MSLTTVFEMGNRWILIAIATLNLSEFVPENHIEVIYICCTFCLMFCLSKDLDLLVPVSSKPHGSSTPEPINHVVHGILLSLCYEKPHLKAGFTLRCFQRLSVPNVATQLTLGRIIGTPAVRPPPVPLVLGAAPSSFCARDG